MQKINNKGFSFIELVTAIAILSVLTGITARSFGNIRVKVQEKQYKIEASAVFEAANLYLFDRSLSGEPHSRDLTDIYLELMRGLDESDHVLVPYFSGIPTKGACITLLGIGTDSSMAYCVESFEYLVGGYLIEVSHGGLITILSYPNHTTQSKRK